MKKILLFILGTWLLYEFCFEKWIKNFNISVKKVKLIVLIGIFFVILFVPQKILKEQLVRIITIWKTLHSKSTPSSTSSSTLTSEKRRVSGYLKKWVASEQGWKCKKCGNTLEASYEVDHILALSDGGKNEESNLMALCRKCHGLKTFRERIKISM